MTASYLFQSDGLVNLARYVAPDTLFAFDLDGTLAPIVAEHSAAHVADPVRIILERIAKLAKVAVITGRSRQDAQKILGFEPHLLIGNHGAEWPNELGPMSLQFEQSCTAWRERLYEMLSGVQGVEIEFKSLSISLHYRKAIDREDALSRIDAAIEKLEPSPRRIGGKFVVNLLPMEAYTKGDALVAAMEILGSERAIYFGDDETDEEVFRMRRIDVFGVHVGKDELTAASHYLNNQYEIIRLLGSIADILAIHCNCENTV